MSNNEERLFKAITIDGWDNADALYRNLSLEIRDGYKEDFEYVEKMLTEHQNNRQLANNMYEHLGKLIEMVEKDIPKPLLVDALYKSYMSFKKIARK